MLGIGEMGEGIVNYNPVKFVFRVPLLHIVANNSIMLPKV